MRLDDIQDDSPLRRGKPAAHAVFGTAQTINSASLAIIESMNETMQLRQPEAMEIAIEELQNLHVGQGYDLYWTRHVRCPSEDEYMAMVSKSTWT